MIGPINCRCCNCVSFTSAQYTNATLVADYADPPGADIPPYPRPQGYVWILSPDCESDPDTDCGVAGNPLCGPWPIADRPTDCDADLLRNQNCYHDEATNTTITVCVDPGHKVVQAKKEWHGRLGFETCPDDCDVITLRYLTMAVEFTYVASATDPDDASSADYAATTSVGQLSGIVDLSDCEYNDNPSVNAPNTVQSLTVEKLSAIRFECGIWSGAIEPTGGETGDEAAAKSNAWNTQVAIQEYEDDGGSLPFTASNSVIVTVYDVSDTEFQYEVELIPTTEDNSVVVTGHATLSDPYYGLHHATHPSVEDDCKNLLAEWVLTNGVQCPWRADGWRGLGTLVYNNENSAQSPDIGMQDCDYVDPDADTYDGTVRGKPFDSDYSATNGTNTCDKTFSWDHETLICCSDDSGCSGGCWETRFYGAWSGLDATAEDATDAVISPMASAWTNNYLAGKFYPGSWAAWSGGDLYYDGPPTRLTLQKQCEAKIQFPSYNLFGPCGAQRHMLDTRIASCISSVSGSDVTTTDDLAALGLTAADKVVWHDGATAKIYDVDAIAGNVITLGAEDTDARNVLDAFDDTWNDADFGTFGIIGKLRVWKRSTVAFIPPAICGKVRVTGVAQDGGDVVLTVATTYTQAGDKIICVEADAADTVFANNGGAGFTLTAASDTQLRFTGTMDEDWLGKYVKIIGAPLAKWNTTASRWNFVWQQFDEDVATGNFDPTPTNIDDRASQNKVLGSTPNSDTDATWTTGEFGTGGGPFPPVPTPTHCGGRALIIPIQLCTDPLWLAPITCGDPITVCAPEVEAMSSARMAEYVAAGAPALPDDCSFNLPTTPPSPGGLDCDTNQPIPHSGQLAPWIPCVT